MNRAYKYDICCLLCFYLNNLSAAVWPCVSLPVWSVCRGSKGGDFSFCNVIYLDWATSKRSREEARWGPWSTRSRLIDVLAAPQLITLQDVCIQQEISTSSGWNMTLVDYFFIIFLGTHLLLSIRKAPALDVMTPKSPAADRLHVDPL